MTPRAAVTRKKMEDDNFERKDCCAFFDEWCDKLCISEFVKNHHTLCTKGPNFHLEYHQNILMCAINSNRMDKIEELLDSGIKPHTSYAFGNAPGVMELAIKLQRVEATQLLLERGGFQVMYYTSAEKYEILKNMTETRNVELFKILIKSEQFKDVINSNWLVMEMYHILIHQQRNFEFAKIMLESNLLHDNDMNIHLFNRIVRLIRHDKEYFEYAHYLIQKLPDVSDIRKHPSGITSIYDNPIYVVCRESITQCEKESLITALLEKGSDPNSFTGQFNQNRDQTLLFYAIDNQNTKLANLLIDFGADIGINHHHAPYRGIPHRIYPLSPLAYAVECSAVNIIKILIAEGADPNITDDVNTPVLSMIRQNEHAQEITEILVAAGAKMDASTADGFGVLNHAFEWNISESIPVLLDVHLRHLQKLGRDANSSDEEE